MESIDEINELKQTIEKMKITIINLEENLKKYTNNSRHIKYYENNKEVVKERTKNYMEKMKTENPEKLKEWRRNYYLKKKEKTQNENTV
jgi:hypothetical protein